MTTTSGLFAGASGYVVVVGGTTTLTGAALASAADASKNSLTTGALVTSDLTNSSSWKASYWGFSFSASTSGMGGVQPGLSQKSTGSSTGLAQATIAPGGVTILNAALQKSLTGKTPDQIVAALNRAAAAQNKAATALPGGLLQTLQNQADRSNALMAASSSTAKLVGDVSDEIAKAAFKAAAEASDPQTAGELLAFAKQWGEGGLGRALLQGVTQGVLAYIGGGYSLNEGFLGAGGAMLSSVLGPILKNEVLRLLNGVGIDDPKAAGLLANLVTEVAITGLGSSFFGTAGALTAASVNLNNFQPHWGILLEACAGGACEAFLAACAVNPVCLAAAAGTVIVAGGAAYLCYECCASLSQSTAAQDDAKNQPSTVPPISTDENGVQYTNTPGPGFSFGDGNGRYYANEADLLRATGGTASGNGVTAHNNTAGWSPTVGPAEVAAYRAGLGIGGDVQTVVVARSDIPALEGQTFGGGSPAVYDAAGQPRPDPGAISCPNPNPLFQNLGEEDIANQFVQAVNNAGLTAADLEGKTLNMFVSNPTGVCTICAQGLANPDVAPGVLKQLSDMYPGLTINITVDTAPGVVPRTGSQIAILNGQRVGG